MSILPAQVSLLLVDDRPENLVALEAILGSGYRLVMASSGQEALDKVLRDDFALILLDVAMPVMTGFDVAERLRKDERTRYIPILFVTAMASGMNDIYTAYRFGAVDYLIKPLDVTAVRAKVAVFADLYRQRKQLEEQSRLLRETERREHELKIAELQVASDERYRKLVEGIDHAFGWSGDAEGRQMSFISRRASALLGYPLEEFARPGFFLDLVPEEERGPLRRAFADTVREQRDHDVTHRLRAADGSARWFHTGVSVTTDRGVELHCLSLDVTPLKMAEEKAAKEANAREQLLQIVSHDLANPLGSIIMRIQRARKALVAGQPTADVIKSVDGVDRAANTMRRLVGDLVDLGQIESGHLVVERRAESVAEILTDAVALLEPLASAKSMSLRVAAETVRSVQVMCDRDRVLQILSNLIGNAIKFSPDRAQIVVAARQEKATVCFSVTDAGPGMPRSQLSRVFDWRWQAKEWARIGTGLGLTISRGLVEAHGGRIWAESTPGIGSTFSFTLPLATSGEHEARP